MSKNVSPAEVGVFRGQNLLDDERDSDEGKVVLGDESQEVKTSKAQGLLGS